MRQTLRLLTTVSVVTLCLSSDAQTIGINRNGVAGHPKAILDLDVSATSGNPFQGMLIPRMTMAQRMAITGLGVADKGLWVYQTDDGTDPGGDPTADGEYAKGYWYYEGVLPSPKDWVRWSTGTSSWKLTGNGNTVATTNYLGTPTGSNDDLYIRTSNNLVNNPALRINATDGFVGVKLGAAPTERLEVRGGVQVGPTALNTIGAIEFDPAAPTPDRWHYGNVDGTATGWRRMENAETRYINQNYCPVVQQCSGADGQKTRGVYGGTPVATSPALGGQVNTPFATNTGANNRQGFRAQYLYLGSELTAIGMCPGLITDFAFYITGSEPACTPGINCPDIKIDIRMGNTALATFGAVTPSQATPTAVDWDAPTEASAQINVNAGLAVLAQPGWFVFTLSGAGFNWTGGNLIIDVSWQRAAALGASPAVQHEVVAGYTCTKYVQVLTNFSPAHGNTYQDNPLTLNAYTGTNSNRPVTRFTGKVTSDGYGAVTTGAYLNYGGGLVIDHNPNPTTFADGAYRGPGSIVASQAVYDGNTQLSDHVFDRYFDNEIAPEDVASAADYAYVPLPSLKDYLKKERHLPNMPSREQWEAHGESSLGELQTGLWESVETQALYITELEKDLSALEALAFGQAKTDEDLARLITEVENSRRLTDSQRTHLINALRARMNAQPDGK